MKTTEVSTQVQLCQCIGSALCVSAVSTSTLMVPYLCNIPENSVSQEAFCYGFGLATVTLLCVPASLAGGSAGKALGLFIERFLKKDEEKSKTV